MMLSFALDVTTKESLQHQILLVKNPLESEVVIIERNESVLTYLKQYMGGVDKADMMLSLYKTKCRTRKWYHRIFIHLIHLAVVNAWIIYQEVEGRWNLFDFLINISHCWMNSNDNDFDSEPVAKRSLL